MKTTSLLFHLRLCLLVCTAAACLPASVSSEELAALLAGVENAKTAELRGEASLRLAEWYGKANEDQKALDAYAEAEKAGLNDRKLYGLLIGRGGIYLREKRYEAAIESFKKAVELFPRSEPAHLELAGAYEASELFEKARKEYLFILKQNERSFDAHFRLANLYLGEGLNDKALDHYRKALTIDSRDDVYVAMSRCAERSGDCELAVAMLNNVISHEQNYDMLVRLGYLYGMQNKVKETESVLSQAVKVNPERVEAYLYLGLLYLRQEDLVPAEKLFQIAAEKAPSEGVIHYFLGTVYGRLGESRKAARELELAQTLARSDILRQYSRRLAETMK